jgi:transposase
MQAIANNRSDIAKSVFQVHGTDADGKVPVRRKLKRHYVLTFFEKLPPCMTRIEACASAHHWSRELQALGHTVKPLRARSDGLFMMTLSRRASVLTTPGPFFCQRANPVQLVTRLIT